MHFAGSHADVSTNNGPDSQQGKRETSYSDLGPLKDNERRDINCAVKEYLLLAGYRLTAMTFYEEVSSIQVFLVSVFCLQGSRLSMLLPFLALPFATQLKTCLKKKKKTIEAGNDFCERKFLQLTRQLVDMRGKM